MLYIHCPMHFRCRVIYPTIILSDLIELTKLIMTIVFILPVKILTNARLAATSGIPLCDVRFIYIEINYVSVLIERPRDFLTSFRDCLEFLPKSLKQLTYPLLGVGPGGPRRLPSGPWSGLRLIKDHAVEADVSGPPRTEFLAFRRRPSSPCVRWVSHWWLNISSAWRGLSCLGTSAPLSRLDLHRDGDLEMGNFLLVY